MGGLGRVVALTAVLSCWSSPAAANGRFPAAGQIAVDPFDDQHLLVRATYGFLQSTDRGATWQWICEESIGFIGIEDPAIAVVADSSSSKSSMLAGMTAGLSASHDRGCTWSFDSGPLAGQFVIDVAAASSQPGRALAITATAEAAGGHHVVVAETLDAGQTWVATTGALEQDLLPSTIEVAGSDPMRLYASGLSDETYQPLFLRSDDGGQSWTRSVMELSAGSVPYIGAVHPADPDRVYVRVDAGATDVLLVSDDGGATFTQLGVFTGALLGMALSPDGSSIAIGGPGVGLQLASTMDHVFTEQSPVTVKCLEWHETGLFACGDEEDAGFTVARSEDQGATFVPLHHRSDLEPLSCPAETPTGAMCPGAWPGVASMLGADSGSSGAGGGVPDAGADPAAAPTDSGCACETGPTSRPPIGSSLVALLSVLLLGSGRSARRRAVRRSRPVSTVPQWCEWPARRWMAAPSSRCFHRRRS